MALRDLFERPPNPEIVQVLPLEAEAVGEEASSGNAGCEFSPQPAELLADLIPLAVKSRLFQCVNDGGPQSKSCE